MSSSDEFARALVPTFLRPINAVFDEFAQYVEQRPWKDKAHWKEELAVARRHLELLVTGAVALQNQQDPGEVVRLREALAVVQGHLDHYRVQITEANRRHSGEVEKVRQEAQLANGERVELNKLRKELTKSAERLAQARATIASYESAKVASRRRDVEIDLVATCLVRALAHLDGVQVIPEEEDGRLQANQIKLVLGSSVARGLSWLTKS